MRFNEGLLKTWGRDGGPYIKRRERERERERERRQNDYHDIRPVVYLGVKWTMWDVG